MQGNGLDQDDKQYSEEGEGQGSFQRESGLELNFNQNEF